MGEPKKKLSKADLKPAVQIKLAATPAPTIARRKKKDEDEEKPMFDDDDKPKAKPKVRDIYAERAKKAEEQEKIVITPAVLPEKEAEAEVEDPLKPKAKVRDEFAE